MSIGAPPERSVAMVEGFQLLEALHHELDAGQRELEQATGGRPICVSQCGKCCERTVPVATGIEVKYLLSQLPRFGAKNVKERALGWLVQNHEGLGLHNKIRGRPYRSEERAQLADDQRILSKAGCPFLAEDKSCTVHEARPLSCRSYGVTLAADAYCPRPLHPSETTERRMGVAPAGPRGKRIQAAKGRLLQHLKRSPPDLGASSWLPGLIARDLARQEVLSLQSEDRIADIKLAMTARAPRLWRDEEEKTIDTIPLQEVSA